MNRQIKVYVTAFWRSDWMMLEDIKKYGFGKTSWKNLEFVIGDDFDIAVILTNPYDNNKLFNPETTIKFLTEPPCFLLHKNIDCIVSSQYLPLSWWIKSSKYKTIESEISLLTTKEELFSTITSDKRFWDGHTQFFVHKGR